MLALSVIPALGRRVAVCLCFEAQPWLRKLALRLPAPTGPPREVLGASCGLRVVGAIFGKTGQVRRGQDSGTCLRLNRNLAGQLQERCVTDLSFAWMGP